MTNYTLPSLASTENKRIFEKVVEARWIRFDELVEKTGIDRETAKEALKELQKDELLARKGAPLEDLAVYYITTKGLRANRLERMPKPALI